MCDLCTLRTQISQSILQLFFTTALMPMRVCNYRGLLFVKPNANGRVGSECVEAIAADGTASGACDDVDSFTQTHTALIEVGVKV
jgi:hypothetical protein